MGARIPGGQPQQAQPQGGGAAELAANVSQGLEAISQMVASQFGEEAGAAIAGLQQQFQQIMLQIGQQGGGGQPQERAAVPSGAPDVRQ